MRDFKGLTVWQRSHRLVLDIYRATRAFPRDEVYGLSSQLKRASASIPANIAEGCGRDSGADFARFLQVAMGSACEVEYHLLLARDLGLLADDEHDSLTRDVSETKRMLTALMRKVRQP